MSIPLRNKLLKYDIGKQNDSYIPPHRFSLGMTKLRQLRIHLQENPIRYKQRQECIENMKRIMREVRMKQIAPMPMTPTHKKSSKEFIELLKERKCANKTDILPQDHYIERKTFFPVAKERIKELRKLGMSWEQIDTEMHVKFINPITNKHDANLKKSIIKEHMESVKEEEQKEKELVLAKTPKKLTIPSAPPKSKLVERKNAYMYAK